MNLDLYFDIQKRKLVNGPQDGGTFSFPPFYQGDTVTLSLHGLTPNPDPTGLAVYVESAIAFIGIKAGIGPGADTVAQAGTFKFRLVGQIETTPALPFDVSQAAALAALNDLASVQAVSALGVKLDAVKPDAINFFLIRWVDPAITARFEIVENRLEPFSLVRETIYALPGGQVQLLKATVAPLAFTDQFQYQPLDPITADVVRPGSSAQNCIQEILCPAQSGGSVSFTFAGLTTAIIPAASLNTSRDGSSLIATALNNLNPDGTARFSVTQQTTGQYYVESIGPLALTDFPELGVNLIGHSASDVPVGTLPLTAPALEMALHGQASIKQFFELEITSTKGVVTLVQTPVTIYNDMIDAAMSLAVPPGWLVPSDPSYPPYDPQGATILAARAYVTQVGSAVGVGNSGASFVIPHNLGTQNCLIEVRETGGTRYRLPDNAYVASYVNDNQIRLDFPTPPADAHYEVIIAAVIPSVLDLPQHTHTVADIDGLQDILNTLINGINPDGPISAARLPARIPWYNSDGAGGTTTAKFAVLPDELLPEDVATLDAGGRLPENILPVGVPHTSDDGSLVLDRPAPTGGTAPAPVVLLDATRHIPVELLPIDPSGWQGLATALLKALQGGAQLKSAIIIQIDDYAESLPPLFERPARCGETEPAYSAPPTVVASTSTPGYYIPGYTIPASTTPATDPKTTTTPGTPAQNNPAQVIPPVYVPGSYTAPIVTAGTKVQTIDVTGTGTIHIPASVLPAVFNAPLSGNLTGGLGAPADPAYAGKRFTVVNGANSVADIWRPVQNFQHGDVIVSNGYHWYAADVRNNVCYPAEYNRELFAFYVSADMLVPNSRFAVDFVLQAQFTSANATRAEYTLTVEIGTPQAATGAGIGDNISGTNWYAKVVEERIIMGSARVFHHFGYAVARDPQGALSAVKSLYASFDLPATQPNGAGFMIRAQLTRFDVEDTYPNPTGQVFLTMLNSTASIVKADANS